MAISSILVSFFVAGTYAERVAIKHAEHNRHADVHVSDFHPQLPLSMPGSNYNPQLPLSVPMQGAPVVIPNMQVGDRSVLSHSRLPGISMQALTKPWPDGKFPPLDEDSYARAAIPPKLIMNLDSMIKDWQEDAMKKKWEMQTSTLKSLKEINEDIQVPDSTIHVFGLALLDPRPVPIEPIDGGLNPEPFRLDRDGERAIKAIATVEFLNEENRYGSHHQYTSVSNRPLVQINGVVSAPNSYQAYGAAGVLEREIINQVIDWAQIQGNVVMITPANHEMERYYRALGFEFNKDREGFENRMFYSGNRERDPPTHLVTLQSD